mmetsp:Transcript_40414/g.104793  ORF Transcript_40414/g.104793 Transcript_40414/m.104793 type:complete len:87 (-) Transcript_40414:393-653(-)
MIGWGLNKSVSRIEQAPIETAISISKLRNSMVKRIRLANTKHYIDQSESGAFGIGASTTSLSFCTPNFTQSLHTSSMFICFLSLHM